MTLIQNIILPEAELQTPLNMYFRLNKEDFDTRDSLESKSGYDYERKILSLAPQDTYYFNSYYNGLSVNVWKENCAIETLSLKLRGRGRAQAKLMLMTQEFDIARSKKKILVHKVLAQRSLELTAEGVLLPIEAWPKLSGGILYLALQTAAGESAEFYGGAFETADAPRQNVNLGIVITHYNRKHYVLPAMKRLKRDILAHPYYGRHIGLAVVDNSRSITPEEADGLTVLPNPNYGGAGGFARGLLHWRDKGFSHCLFMDDDASCETESIYRTLSLLQFAKDERLAVSGAMLREAEPYRLWSKGEYYQHFAISSPKRGLDMRKAADLLQAEADDYSQAPQRQYGGFWHFAFPIAETKHYPFPFFVRGDDLLFGLVNPFHVVTLNGIGNFAEDFCLKESPFIAYLALRCNFMVETAAGAAQAEQFIRRYKRWLRGQLYAYNYAHARAFSLSAENFMKGLPFWRQNLDIAALRQQILSQASGETVQEQKTAARGILRYARREGFWRKLFRKATWQGFLLPKFMLKDSTALIAKNFGGSPAASFRRRHIFYYAEDLSHGYYAEYDKKRFFAEWRLARATAKNMKRNLQPVLDDYRKNWHKFASESFWREIYAEELQTPDASAAAACGQNAADLAAGRSKTEEKLKAAQAFAPAEKAASAENTARQNGDCAPSANADCAERAHHV